jgi:hypothetical protein
MAMNRLRMTFLALTVILLAASALVVLVRPDAGSVDSATMARPGTFTLPASSEQAVDVVTAGNLFSRARTAAIEGRPDGEPTR